jgi:LysM repeat protein
MRTKTIARWRRAALAGTLAASLLAVSARAEQAPAADAQQGEEQGKLKDSPADLPAAQPGPEAAPKRRGETAPIAAEKHPRPPPPDGHIQPVPGSPDEYTIVKGDTLWDLSQKFLNNPWYWPKIWSLNPAIENPHWIYPGNKLRLVPGEGGGPAQVQAPVEPDIDASAANAPPDQDADFTNHGTVSVTPPATADLDVIRGNSKESNAALNTVSVSGKLAFTPPPVVRVQASGLVSPEEMRSAGRIQASFEEKEMLANYDTAYVRFRQDIGVKPGEKLLSFRPGEDIIDPVTHRKLATQTITTAVLKVLSVDGTQVTVQVERTFEEVSRGDYVRPWAPQDKRIAPKNNAADLRGVIVRSTNNHLNTFGESHEVFIDLGAADGVQEGNTFAVVRRGDGLNARMVTGSLIAGAQGAAAARAEIPEENVGLLLVVDTTEHLSTALVVKSVRELEVGDQVEMRAAGAGGG